MAGPSWPCLNQSILMGKVSRVTRIQWEDGSTTALIRVATYHNVATPDGWRVGFDHHEVEVSPGEKAFKDVWDGAIVVFRGPIHSFDFKPEGALKSFNRHVMKAAAFTIVKDSDKDRVIPSTVLRKYREETRESVESHNHQQTERE